jgi:hypothetical protein
MSDSTAAHAMSDLPTKTALPRTLSFDERWATWREEGAGHDARSARHMRLLALIILLTIGIISALVWVR